MGWKEGVDWTGMQNQWAVDGGGQEERSLWSKLEHPDRTSINQKKRQRHKRLRPQLLPRKRVALGKNSNRGLSNKVNDASALYRQLVSSLIIR